jgi:SAM-dependent methyltransferase
MARGCDGYPSAGPQDYRRDVSTTDPATAYGLFTGRFSQALARPFADFAALHAGQRAVDVGCGPGALTEVLVQRLGAESVHAVDPSEAFVDAARARLPGVDVRRGSAEQLPYGDDTFDAALAQLVVHFMADPVGGLGEMARVTRPGGVVAACVWDNAGGHGPLSPLWIAARELDPTVRDESGGAGAREGHLAELAGQAGLEETESARLRVDVRFETFDEWWAPLTHGVGSGGAYVVGLEDSRREELGRLLAHTLGPSPFTVSAFAWSVRAKVPESGGRT